VSKGKLNSRAAALKALIQFHKTKNSPSEILKSVLPDRFSERDKALVREMTIGTIKLEKRLEFIAQSYIKAPITRQKPEIKAALALGFYQLTELTGVPDFAAVDETVSAVKEILSSKDAGFVNAVLRAYLMKPNKVRFPDIDTDPVQYLSLYYSYPKWLVMRWLERLGYDETEKMLKAGNSRPKIFFKILESKISPDDANRILSEDGIDIITGKYFSDYFRSENSGEILKHALFTDGKLIVQDESQGIPFYLLNPPPGSAVLDLCAAPGGKTIALADRVGDNGRVVAIDFSSRRLKELEQNVKRTGLENIEIHKSDVLDFERREKFSYILLDVPCSGLGTIAGNADLRWTKSEKDIMILSDMQKKLLAKTAEFIEKEGVRY
jgi:16S rRNA (cytosine967-C5)-methyltransferase